MLPLQLRVSAVVLVITLLCACAQQQTPIVVEGPMTISFGATEAERTLYKPLIERFNRENTDMRVQFVALPPEFGLSQSGSDPLLERARAADTWATSFIQPELIRRGYVRDLKPLLDADATFDMEDFYPSALASVSVGNTIAGVPRTFTVPLIQYNKDMWQRIGLLPPKPTWTWGDVATAATLLAQSTNDGYGLLEWSAGEAALYGELSAAGVNLASQSPEQLNFATFEITTAVERVVKLAEQRAIFLPGAGFNSDDFKVPIREQQIGMWLYGSYIINPSDPKPTFAIGTAAFPAIPSGLLGSTDGYVMSAGTQHPQEAWRWLSFLSHQLVKKPFDDPTSASRLFARPSLAEQSGYWKQQDAETQAAVRAVLGQTVPTIDQQAINALGGAVRAMVQNQRPVVQALADAQQQAVAQMNAEQNNRPQIAVATPMPLAAQENTTAITFAGMGGMQLEQVVQRFNQSQTAIRVELAPINLGGSVSIAEQAANTDCFSAWSAPQTADLPTLLNLQPLLDADATFPSDDYPAALLAPYQKNSGLYGLPYSAMLRFVAYNPDLFAAAGLAAPSANWTMDDFREAAQRLTATNGETPRYGFTGPTPQDLVFFLDHLGAEPFAGNNENAQPNFTDTQVEQAIRSYLDILRNDSPHKRFIGYEATENDDNGFSEFAQGRSGMFLSFATGMDRPGDFTTTLAPPPFGASGPTANDMQPAIGLFISSRSKHPEACWTWLRFLSGEYALMLDGFPARISMASSPAFQQTMLPGAADVYNAYRPFFTQQSAIGAPLLSYDGFERDRMYWLFRAVDRALQGADLAQELDEAQYFTSQYLTCVRSGEDVTACPVQIDPSYSGFSKAATSP